MSGRSGVLGWIHAGLSVVTASSDVIPFSIGPQANHTRGAPPESRLRLKHVNDITYRGGCFCAVTTQINTRLGLPPQYSAEPCMRSRSDRPKYLCMQFWAKKYIILVKLVLYRQLYNVTLKFKHPNAFYCYCYI